MSKERCPAGWDDLARGLPCDFDFTQIRTVEEAERIIFMLPNADRGNAARGLYRERKKIGNDVAFAGMMKAWGHDHAGTVKALGSQRQFAKTLRRVAPPHGRTRPVQAWRGVTIRNAAWHPAEAAMGIAWTTERDVAAWFALRFHDSNRRAFVFHTVFDADEIIVFGDESSENEIIIDLGDFPRRRVIVDYDGTNCFTLDCRAAPSKVTLGTWREAHDRYERAKQTRLTEP
jgi:hypothetical protein